MSDQDGFEYKVRICIVYALSQRAATGQARICFPITSVGGEPPGPSGAHADRRRPPRGPAECSRHQLRSGEPNTGTSIRLYVNRIQYLFNKHACCVLNNLRR